MQTKNAVRADLLRHNLTIEEFARRHGYKSDTVKAVLYKNRQYGPVARQIREDLKRYESDECNDNSQGTPSITR